MKTKNILFKLSFLFLTAIPFCFSAHAQSGVGGGNVDENPYTDRQNLLRDALLRGDLTRLEMEAGMSEEIYTQKMLAFLPPAPSSSPGVKLKFPPVLIHFTDEKVALKDGSPKACRSWIGNDPQSVIDYQPDESTLALLREQGLSVSKLGHTLCNRKIYIETFNDLEKLQQTAHETAVLAGLEDHTAGFSTYFYSRQLSLEPTAEVVFKVVVKSAFTTPVPTATPSCMIINGGMGLPTVIMDQLNQKGYTFETGKEMIHDSINNRFEEVQNIPADAKYYIECRSIDNHGYGLFRNGHNGDCDSDLTDLQKLILHPYAKGEKTYRFKATDENTIADQIYTEFPTCK
jgi:hypothetical protein